MKKRDLCVLAMSLCAPMAMAYPASADAVSDAKAYVEKVTKPNPPWDGPTTGPPGGQGEDDRLRVGGPAQWRRQRCRRGRHRKRPARSGWTVRITRRARHGLGPRQLPLTRRSHQSLT